MPRHALIPLVIFIVWLPMAGCVAPSRPFDGKRALKDIETLCSYGERPVGSAALTKAGDYIIETLQKNGWQVEEQRFAYQGQNLRNIIGKKGSGPLVILGTHYDTRPLADRDPHDRSLPVMGANDGGSGTAVLLELARVLRPAATDQAEIWLVFFDGEDRGEIDGWPWCVGSTEFAARMMAGAYRMPEYVLVVDMVGDTEQAIYYEWSSTLWLMEKVWGIAAELGYGAHFIPEYRYRIIDDHAPFLNRGITAAVMIDFDYPYWHTRYDTVDKISVDSLQRVGHVLQTLLEGEPFGVRAVQKGP
jgi:Zn-dependent M28 family amino/carboxypeptidase